MRLLALPLQLNKFNFVSAPCKNVEAASSASCFPLNALKQGVLFWREGLDGLRSVWEADSELSGIGIDPDAAPALFFEEA